MTESGSALQDHGGAVPPSCRLASPSSSSSAAAGLNNHETLEPPTTSTAPSSICQSRRRVPEDKPPLSPPTVAVSTSSSPRVAVSSSSAGAAKTRPPMAPSPCQRSDASADCVEQLHRMLSALDDRGKRSSSEPPPRGPSAADEELDSRSAKKIPVFQLTPPSTPLELSPPPTTMSAPASTKSTSSPDAEDRQNCDVVSSGAGSLGSASVQPSPPLPCEGACGLSPDSLDQQHQQQSNMMEHLRNLILLMEELSALRRQNNHLTEKVEYLENSQMLLRCKASMLQENCKCHNHSFELATLSRKMQRSKKLSRKSGSDKSLHKAGQSVVDGGAHAVDQTSSGITNQIKGATISKWGKFFTSKKPKDLAGGHAPPLISGPVSPVDYLGGFSGPDGGWNQSNIPDSHLQALGLPTSSTLIPTKTVPVMPTSIGLVSSQTTWNNLPTPTSTASQQTEDAGNPSPTLSTKSEPIASHSGSTGVTSSSSSTDQARAPRLAGRGAAVSNEVPSPRDKSVDAEEKEKKRKRSNTAPAPEPSQLERNETKPIGSHSNGPNGGSTWSRVRDVIAQTKRKASSNPKQGCPKTEGELSPAALSKPRPLVKQSSMPDASVLFHQLGLAGRGSNGFGVALSPASNDGQLVENDQPDSASASRPTSLELRKASSRSRSTSLRRESPSILPRQAASVESSASSTSGRGSIKVSSSPQPSPPRVKRGSSKTRRNRGAIDAEHSTPRGEETYSSTPESPIVFQLSQLDSERGLGGRVSSPGAGSRFSSFEEPGQFVRIPMSDVDGLDGLPDSVRQGGVPTRDWELMLGAHEFKRTTRRSLEDEKKERRNKKEKEKEGRSLRDKLSSFLNLEDDFTRKMKEWEKMKRKASLSHSSPASSGCPVSSSSGGASGSLHPRGKDPSTPSFAYHYSYGTLPSLPFSPGEHHVKTSRPPPPTMTTTTTSTTTGPESRPHRRKQRSSSEPSVEGFPASSSRPSLDAVSSHGVNHRSASESSASGVRRCGAGARDGLLQVVIRDDDDASHQLATRRSGEVEDPRNHIEDFLVSGATETCLVTPDDDEDDDAHGCGSGTNTIRNSGESRDGMCVDDESEPEVRRRTLVEDDANDPSLEQQPSQQPQQPRSQPPSLEGQTSEDEDDDEDERRRRLRVEAAHGQSPSRGSQDSGRGETDDHEEEEEEEEEEGLELKRTRVDLKRLHISESDSEAGSSARGSLQKVTTPTATTTILETNASSTNSRHILAASRIQRGCVNYRDVDSAAALFGPEERPLSLESRAVAHRFKHLRVLNATPPRRALKNQRRSLENRRGGGEEERTEPASSRPSDKAAPAPQQQQQQPRKSSGRPRVGRESDSGQSDSAEERLSTRSEFVRCSRSRLREPIRLPRGSDRRAKSEGRGKESQLERLQRLQALTRAQESRKSERSGSSAEASSVGVVGRENVTTEAKSDGVETVTNFLAKKVEDMTAQDVEEVSSADTSSSHTKSSAIKKPRLEHAASEPPQPTEQSIPVSPSPISPISPISPSIVAFPYQSYVPSSPALSSRRYTSLPKLKSAQELMTESKNSRLFGAGTSGSSASPSPELTFGAGSTSSRGTTTPVFPTVRMPRTYEPGTVKKLLRTFSSEGTDSSAAGAALESSSGDAPSPDAAPANHPPLRRLTAPTKRPEPRGMERRYQMALEEARRLELERAADANGNVGLDALDDKEVSLVEQWLLRKNTRSKEPQTLQELQQDDRSDSDAICCQTASTPSRECSPRGAGDGVNINNNNCGPISVAVFASERNNPQKFPVVFSDNKHKMVNHTKRLFKVNN